MDMTIIINDHKYLHHLRNSTINVCSTTNQHPKFFSLILTQFFFNIFLVQSTQFFFSFKFFVKIINSFFLNIPGFIMTLFFYINLILIIGANH